jgi:BT1 family
MNKFARISSALIVAGVIEWSGMITVGDDCNFDALPSIIVITQILVPIIIGIPAIYLIPNALQTEPLIDWVKEGWYSERTDDPEESGLLTNNNDGSDMDDQSRPETEQEGKEERGIGILSIRQ